MAGQLNITLLNDIAEIERLHNLITEFANRLGLTKKKRLELNLALEEIVTNAINYAFTDDREHEIQVHISLRENELRVEVVDGGKPFNPLGVPTPDMAQDVEDRPVGGLGIHLVRSVMDELDYRRIGEQNHLTMKIKI